MSELSLSRMDPDECSRYTAAELAMLEEVRTGALADLTEGDARFADPGMAETARIVLAASIFVHAKRGERDPATLKRLALTTLASHIYRPSPS